MVVLRKKLPPDAAVRLQGIREIDQVPQESPSSPGPPNRHDVSSSRDTDVLINKTENLVIWTEPQPKKTEPSAPGYLEYLDEYDDRPPTPKRNDFVPSPTCISPTGELVQTPSSITNSDAFFTSFSSGTPSDAFFETPDTSFTSDDSLQNPTNSIHSTTSQNAPKQKSKITSAMEDASIFLGGLIRHPTESTRHFTILRHSHGIVYYKGPSTSVAITIFADKPLPPDRRLWLQMKGWTGKTGMRAKALLRTNASWINVTPDRRVKAEELPPLDERAWQRDIKKFLDKAPKSLKKHAVRETAVLRVPFEAVDGYFRVVLTKGDNRSTLCPSPVFRVASTSMSASSIKGASISTLPIELGIKLLQYTATQAASNAVMPLGSTVREQAAQYMPSFWVQEAATSAYDATGIQDQLDDANEQYDQRREQVLEETGEAAPYIGLKRPDIAGPSSGPESPFPIRINSRIVRGTGRGLSELGMPTANLDSVPADLIAPLSGTYFGWAFIQPKNDEQRDLPLDWRHAIISIHPCSHQPATVAPKKLVKAYLIYEFEGQEFFDSKISLVIMGFLRPRIPYEDKEAYFHETIRDISITQASLERDEWGPETSIERIKSAKSARSISERYIDARKYGQRQVDKVPVHRLGVRSPTAGFNDRTLYGNGGLCVIRDS